MTIEVGNVLQVCGVAMEVRQFFSFPGAVNETSARLVALGVVAQALLFFAFREGWLLVPLVYGFSARVLTGPTMSPLGQLSVRLATPFVERRFGVATRRMPGPPKRFAQMTAGAMVAWETGATWLAYSLLSGLLVAASLEAFAAVCLGCIAYSAMWGCDDCDDISERLAQAVLRARETAPVDSELPVTTN
jgi:hypothetical protein